MPRDETYSSRGPMLRGDPYLGETDTSRRSALRNDPFLEGNQCLEGTYTSGEPVPRRDRLPEEIYNPEYLHAKSRGSRGIVQGIGLSRNGSPQSTDPLEEWVPS